MTFPDLVVEFAPGSGPFDAISYLGVDGSAAVACSVTDSASTSPTEAMEVIAQVRPTVWADGADQAIVAKWTSSGNQRTFTYGINATGGLYAELSDTGGDTKRYDSLESMSDRVADDSDRWLRWTFNNGVIGTNHIVGFFEGPDGVSWRQVGYAMEDETTFSLFDSTSPTVLGNTSDNDAPFTGRIYSVSLATNGINDFDEPADAPYLDADFTSLAASTTSFADGGTSGATWLVQSAGDVTEMTDWVDISDYVLTAGWSDGKDVEHEAFPPGDATIVLKNDDRRFDPDNSSGPYFGDLEPRTPFRIRSTVDSGSSYASHFYGFVESGFEQTYGHPETSTCTVKLTDLLGVITGYVLPSVLDREIMREEPFAYWPLDDEPGTTLARDASGNGFDGTYRNDPVLTSVDEGIVFNGAAREFNGVNQAVDFPNTARLNSGSSNWSVMTFYQSSTPSAVNDYSTFYNAGGDSHEIDVLRFNLDDTERHFMTYVESGSGFSRQSVSSDFHDGSKSAVMWSIYTTTNITTDELGFRGFLHVNGESLEHESAVQTSNVTSAVVVGGHPVPANTQDYLNGKLSHVTLFEHRLTYPRTVAIHAAGSAPLSGSRSDEQIAWVLDYIGVPTSLRNLDEGRALMGSADTKGKDALEFIRQVTETEGGGFYVDHADGGKLRFVERYTHWTAARSTTAQATFSDDSSSTTAVRVEPGSLVVRPNGIDSVINQVSVTWVGGTQRVEDAASIRRWGPRGREVDAQAGTPYQALGLAQWLLALATEPQTAVVGLGLNPGAAQAAFPVARDLRINDLITFRSQPQSTGSVTTRSLLVLGSAHEVERGVSWRVDYRVSSSPTERGVSLFTLDESLLDSSDILAY